MLFLRCPSSVGALEILGGHGGEVIAQCFIGARAIGTFELIEGDAAHGGMQIVGVGLAVPLQESAIAEGFEGGVEVDG
ncbi:MAG: hypothetical protein WDO18_00630 [Acidobacteriota bacterium]